jgi:hypothetical protein
MKTFLLSSILFLSLSIIAKSKPLPENCKKNCVTPYGQHLGQDNTGVPAYSNCQSQCVIFTPNKALGVYSGIKWQCVEYSRRWLIVNKQLTYGSVDFAADIWKNISHYTHTMTKAKIPVESRLNGSPYAPRVGDLLIYAKEFEGTGHVAVITQVSLANKTVSVSEENYENKPWTHNYARKLNMVVNQKKFWILDPYLIGWKTAIQ